MAKIRLSLDMIDTNLFICLNYSLASESQNTLSYDMAGLVCHYLPTLQDLCNLLIGLSGAEQKDLYSSKCKRLHNDCHLNDYTPKCVGKQAFVFALDLKGEVTC